MKCPYCNYFHGWDSEKSSHEEGDKGEFYELPIQFKRAPKFMGYVDSEKVYACPKCKKLFLEG